MDDYYSSDNRKLQDVFFTSVLSFNDANVFENCGNGICEDGESCLTCDTDCISGTVGGFDCGNGVCEDGETCYTCPYDCNGNIEEDEFFCCYGGDVDPKVPYSTSCKDERCGQQFGKCNAKNSPINSYCCGDGTCNGEESEYNCPVDNCHLRCGNGVCDAGENADNCALDCPCTLNGNCDVHETINACPLDCP